MSGTHDTDAVRTVNPEITLLLLEILKLIRLALAGSIPLKGRFTPEVWSMWFGNKPATIREWVAKYNIPHKMPGNEMVIDAEDFWKAIPYGNAFIPEVEEPARPRKKKG